MRGDERFEARRAVVGTVLVLLLLGAALVLLRYPARQIPAEATSTPPPTGTDGTSDRGSVVPPPVPVAPDPGTCFRVGSTRDEVRAAMGAPDSIAFRLYWDYGPSTVVFDAYGVVSDFSDAGGNLRLCP